MKLDELPVLKHRTSSERHYIAHSRLWFTSIAMETALRSAMISAARRSVGTVSARHALFTSRGSTSPCRSLQQARDFHQRLPRTYIAATSRRYVSLMPESQDPPAPNPESQVNSSVEKGPTDPTPLTDQEYHEHADRYLNSVIQEVEGLQEDRQDVDFEHAVCTFSRLQHCFQLDRFLHLHLHLHFRSNPIPTSPSLLHPCMPASLSGRHQIVAD